MCINKFCFLLLIFSIVSGCSSYQISPVLELSKESQPIQIDSYSINISENTKIWTKSSILNKTESVLNSSKKLASVPNGNAPNSEPYYHMAIDVKYWHGGAGGEAFITALSLGLIPTKGEHRDLFVYKFNLYKNGKLVRENIYSINEEHYNHLVLLPFALIDNLFTNPPVSLYREALVKNVHI